MILAAFVTYGTVLALIGVLGYLRTQDYADFVLGGRRLGPWVAAISAGASDMSGWLLLALPGLAATALAEAFWVAAGLALGTYLNWRLVARRLRIATFEADDAVTLPEFLARRYPASGATLRRLSALVIIVFFTLYAAAGLVAGAKLFVSVFDIGYVQGLLIGAAVVLAYTYGGGFFAVALTDLVQGVLMLLALSLVPLLALREVGIAAGAQISPFDPGGPLGIASALAWGLGYFGQPHILARFMALDDPAVAGRARRIATAWTGLGLAAALAVGIVGSAPEFGPLLGPDPERIFLELIPWLLPPAVAGICLAGVLAAVMSTADSQLLVAASAIATDLVGTGKGALVRGRLGVMAVLAVAVTIAADPDSRVLDLVAWAWAGFGATFGPLVLLTLYRPKLSERAALATLCTGCLVVLGWRGLPGPASEVYELLPAFFTALAAGVAVDIAIRSSNRANGRHE
mgnify:CR=1 FL=1